MIHVESKRFETETAATALDRWVDLGVLHKQLVRRARTCPECEAVCSVGTGCSQCGDFNLQYRDLVHHFACAHVNDTRRFDNGHSIQCPKCLRNDLVAGADFELIRSQYTCGNCHYEGEATAQVGNCLNCHLRFRWRWGRRLMSMVTMWNEWIYWLSSIPLDELLWIVLPLLLFDGLRYCFTSLCVWSYDFACRLSPRKLWDRGSGMTPPKRSLLAFAIARRFH